MLFALIAASILPSCSSKDSDDARDLLLSIPSDASMVGIADLHEVLEKAGCDIDGTEIKPGKEFSEAIGKSGSDLGRIFRLITEGGIDPSVAAIFLEGYNFYIAGFVADPDLFRETIEKEFGEKFADSGEVSVCGNVALSGSRFWVCLSSRNTIRPDDIRHFINLTEKQSIISNKKAAALEKLSHHIQGWGDIKGCLAAAGLDFASRATAMMALEAMYADPAEFLWELDFEKGELEGELSVFNTKGGVARFLYPVAKIDADAIRSLSTNSDALFAIAISPETVRMLREETKTKGVSMLGLLAGALGCVDGTCVYSGDIDKNVNGFLSTTGSGTADISDILSSYGLKVTKEGKLLRFASGLPSGRITPDEAATLLKGAMAGAIFSGRLLSDKGMSTSFSCAAVKLVPEKGGLQLDFTVASADKGRNILLSILSAETKTPALKTASQTPAVKTEDNENR